MITINRRPKVMIRIREDISRIGMTSENDEGSMDVRNSSKEKGVIISPLPGVMTGIKVNVGDKVSIGTELAVLEAMKMENSIESEHEGIVTDIYISKGDSVLEGTPLMKIQ
jgi:pyruvate carboxylase subunit B